MKKLLFTSLITAPLLLTTPIIADQVTDPIKTALDAYKDKDFKLALEELKYAMAALQKMDSAENNKLLPDALEGWTKEVEDTNNQLAMNMMGGGQMMSAKYTKGDASIQIQITANSPLIASMGMMINNPMYATGEGMEPYRYKRLKGIKEKRGDMTSITLLLAGQIMIKLEGNQLEGDQVLEDYLKSMNMKKIKSSLLQ